MNYYLDVVKKYAVFNGRARRKEYWMYALFYSIFAVVASILDSVIGTGGIIYGIYALAFFVPTLAVAIRRLHDIGKGGVWILIALVPVIGSIWLLILLCKDSEPGDNTYGPNPKQY